MCHPYVSSLCCRYVSSLCVIFMCHLYGSSLCYRYVPCLCVIFMSCLCVISMCHHFCHLFTSTRCREAHSDALLYTQTNVYANTYIIRRIDCGCWCSIFQCLPLRLSLAKRRSTLHLEMRLPFLARPEVTRHTSDTSTGLVKVVLCPRVSNLTWCFCE